MDDIERARQAAHDTVRQIAEADDCNPHGIRRPLGVRDIPPRLRRAYAAAGYVDWGPPTGERFSTLIAGVDSRGLYLWHKIPEDPTPGAAYHPAVHPAGEPCDLYAPGDQWRCDRHHSLKPCAICEVLP